ncbi:MAG: FxsA family protein [Acidimicrobiia bacterium]|jgi:UPF0716 protein FxsA
MRFLSIFALLALAEMATFFWVESRVGLGWALGMALGTAFLGSILVRRAGVAVLARMREKWGQGVLPGRELSDGAAILVAGAFLISPGFLTDTLGFLLLVPWVRGHLYALVTSRFADRATLLTPPSDTIGEGVIDVDELD